MMCVCGHPKDEHENGPCCWAWDLPLPAKGCSCEAFQPSREWLSARLSGLAVEASLESLVTAVAMLEELPKRDISPAALMAAQRARESGTEAPLRAVDVDAASLGRALALVAREVERAALKHGRTFPGGWGPHGRTVDQEMMLRAKDTCDAANAAGGASFRHVLQEEVSEAFAEVAGSAEQAKELVQVAAVCVRGVLVASIDEVREGRT